MLKFNVGFGIERAWFLVVHTNILTFLSIFIVTFMLSQSMHAADIHGGGSCDAGIWQTHTKRAWLSGKHELEVAQTLILKPDSVLEYSCFPQRRAELAGERTRWTGRTLEGGWLDGALGGVVQEAISSIVDLVADTGGIGRIIGTLVETEFMDNFPIEDPLIVLVQEPLDSYVRDNFYHTWGGGIYDDSLATGALCDGMRAIWDFMKCHDFDENSFLTFGTMAANDIRTLPLACPVNDPMETLTREEKWDANIALAYPPPEYFPALDDYSDVGAMDLQAMRYERTDPERCDLMLPVPTGIVISNTPPGDPGGATQADWYPDMICPGTGCHYVPSPEGGSNSGSCSE